MGQVRIRVQPRSTQNKIEVTDGLVKVWVTSAPTDGQANAAVCHLIAKTLAIPKTTVTVVKGQTSRDKIISVDSLDDVAIIAKLNS